MDVEARLGLLMQGFKVRVDCVLGPGPEGLLQQRREVVQLVREVGEPERGDNIMYYQMSHNNEEYQISESLRDIKTLDALNKKKISCKTRDI